MPDLSFAAVAKAATDVAATSSRTDKTTVLADVLQSGGAALAPIVVGLLTGEVRQGRIGVGWAAIRDVTGVRATTPTLSVAEVDAAIAELAETTGPGSKSRRGEVLDDLFAAATSSEADFLGAVLSGGLRQGALDGVMTAGIAKAADVTQASVRRAAMLSGDLGETAAVALSNGATGLAAVGLRVGRGVSPCWLLQLPA